MYESKPHLAVFQVNWFGFWVPGKYHWVRPLYFKCRLYLFPGKSCAVKSLWDAKDATAHCCVGVVTADTSGWSWCCGRTHESSFHENFTVPVFMHHLWGSYYFSWSHESWEVCRGMQDKQLNNVSWVHYFIDSNTSTIAWTADKRKAASSIFLSKKYTHHGPTQ